MKRVITPAAVADATLELVDPFAIIERVTMKALGRVEVRDVDGALRDARERPTDGAVLLQYLGADAKVPAEVQEVFVLEGQRVGYRLARRSKTFDGPCRSSAQGGL